MSSEWNPQSPNKEDEQGNPDAPASRPRRRWIKGILGTVAVAVAGYFSWTRFFFPPSSPRPWEGQIGAGGAQQGALPLGQVSQFANSKDPVQVAVRGQAAFVDFTGGSAKVLNAQCTHQRCTIAWDGKKSRYVCPCHNSMFARDGSVIQGPATRPLALIPSVVDGDTVYAEA